MALLREMREAGLTPNVVSYTAAIAACKVGVDISAGKRDGSGFKGKRGAAAVAERLREVSAAHQRAADEAQVRQTLVTEPTSAMQVDGLSAEVIDRK